MIMVNSGLKGLSSNLLTILVNRSLAKLNNIKILKFNRNPIIYIKLSIFKNLPNVWILDIAKLYLLKCKFSFI